MSDAGDATSKGADFLGKKIGPFTAQTWIIIAGGGAIVVYMIIRKRNAGSTPLTTDSFTNPNADSISSQAGGSSSGTVNTANGTPNTFTNAQWALNASNGLIAGGDDPTTVSNALSKYMNGQSLSAAEAAIVAVAITTYGEPPQGVLPVTTGSTPSGPSNNGADPLTSLIYDGVNVFKQFAGGTVQHVDSPDELGTDLSQTNQTHEQSIFSQFVRDNLGQIWGLAEYTTPATNGEAATTAGQWTHLDWNQYSGLGKPAYTQVSAAPTSVAGTAHTYTALTGDTMANISQRFLGTSDTSKLAAANPSLHDPISPGTVINIPAS